MLKITSRPPPPLPPPTHPHTHKLKTGLSCHHSFNNDKRYYVTSSIGKDVDRLIEEWDKAFAKYRGAYHIGSKSIISEARKRKGAEKKNQRKGDWTLQITDKKELALYLDPWEESLLNFVMSQIYVEFSKSIQSMKKHYFYSHQKPSKLVYEICLIPIVLWGKLKNKFMIFALHRISSIN